jgi:hypothetical protein
MRTTLTVLDVRSPQPLVKDRNAESKVYEGMRRYHAGARVLALMNDGNKYGKQYIPSVMSETGYGSVLYEYASVADAWPADEVERMLRWSLGSGKRPITISHLCLLAAVKDPCVRARLLIEARNNGWSVAVLKRECRRRPG